MQFKVPASFMKFHVFPWSKLFRNIIRPYIDGIFCHNVLNWGSLDTLRLYCIRFAHDISCMFSISRNAVIVLPLESKVEDQFQ